MKTLLSLVILLAMVCSVQAGTQVLEGNTVDFSPSSYALGESVLWNMATSSWNYDGTGRTQFANEVYSRNDQYVNQWQRINTQQTRSGPGLVYHFQADQAVAMDLLVELAYTNGNWGGHKFDVYFSDENDFANLSPMAGGNWGASETNPLWTSLYSHSIWGSDGGQSVSETAHSVDGDFYVRFDMVLTDGTGQGFQSVSSFDVSGTVVPEPTMLLSVLAGALLSRRRLG